MTILEQWLRDLDHTDLIGMLAVRMGSIERIYADLQERYPDYKLSDAESPEEKYELIYNQSVKIWRDMMNELLSNPNYQRELMLVISDRIGSVLQEGLG